MITQKIDLNLIPGRVLPRVNVSQYDKGTRTLEFTVYNGDVSFDPTSYTAYIQGFKPDGHGFDYPATIASQKITADVTEQMTAVAGEVLCEVIINDGTDQIGTGNFILNVERAALPDDAEISDSEYAIVQQAIEDAREAAAEAEMWSSNAPYIGDNGDWYVYDADQEAFVDTGIHAQGPQGETGATGATGATGNGIASITKTGTSGLVDTYTITYTNGTTSTFTVTNGQDGTGAGDMLKSVYDTNNNGVVDNSEKLDGHPASYFAVDQTMTGATSSVAGAKGLVPAPAAGDQDKFLKGDGTWANLGNMGHTIWNAIKTAMTKRGVLWFKDAHVTDDAGNSSTDVEIITNVTSAQFTALATDGSTEGAYNITDENVIPVDASMIGYDNTQSGLSANNPQDAIDELSADITTVTSANITSGNASVSSLSKAFKKSGVVTFGGYFQTTATIPQNTKILTMPASYRPSEAVVVMAISTGGKSASITVKTNGDIDVSSDNMTSGYWSLVGCIFA